MIPLNTIKTPFPERFGARGESESPAGLHALRHLIFEPVSHRNRGISRRRKGTVQKYDPPYSKKPPQKSYSGVSGNHHAEAAALDTVNKILTFGRMPQYRYDDPFAAYPKSIEQTPFFTYKRWGKRRVKRSKYMRIGRRHRTSLLLRTKKLIGIVAARSREISLVGPIENVN